ncbi:unnamed protein product, partial [Trichogramma brassicae]
MDDVGNLTDFRAYTSGVPQGSTPAPILFAVYIDSLTRIFRHCASTHMMFADNLQIYLQCPPSEINSTIAKLNEEAQSVANWAHDNGLMLNISKTKAILFAFDQNLMRIPWDLCSRIVLEGTEIRFEDCVKNLGLSMYRSLSWRNHVSVISSRVHGVLHRLRSAAGFLPADIKKILVNTVCCKSSFLNDLDIMTTLPQATTISINSFIFSSPNFSAPHTTFCSSSTAVTSSITTARASTMIFSTRRRLSAAPRAGPFSTLRQRRRRITSSHGAGA